MGKASSKTFTPFRLDGKTAVVTGSNTGIGKETVKELYKQGARVLLACRDTKKAQDAVDDIKSELDKIGAQNVGEMVVKQLNLSSLQSVKQCAEDINNTEGHVHYLINNAGVMACPKGETEDGFETQFGTNHLGHFLLTGLLVPKLIQSAPSRIINVSSRAHEQGVIDIEDPNFKNRSYSPWKSYSQSKLANILFSVSLADKLKERLDFGPNRNSFHQQAHCYQGQIDPKYKGVVVYSLHPGIVKTELGRHMDEAMFRGARQLAGVIFYPFYKTPQQGAETSLYCVFKKDEGDSGGYFSDCALNKTFSDEKNLKIAEQLWKISCEMVNLPESWNL